MDNKELENLEKANVFLRNIAEEQTKTIKSLKDEIECRVSTTDTKIKELEAEIVDLKEFRFCVKDIMDCGYEDSDSLVLNNLETREEVYEDYRRSRDQEVTKG